MKNIFMLVPIIALLAAGCSLSPKMIDKSNVNQPTSAPLEKVEVNDKSDNLAGQKYEDANNHYSYICPDDFTLGNNLDFNGKVEVSECSKNYSDSKFEFIDGVSVKFEFVPTSISDTEMNGDRLWSEQKLDIKSAPGTTTYNRNSFSGWMSDTRQNNGYVNILAQQNTTGGYYELNAIIAINNNDQLPARLTIIDNIVDSFIAAK